MGRGLWLGTGEESSPSASCAGRRVNTQLGQRLLTSPRRSQSALLVQPEEKNNIS